MNVAAPRTRGDQTRQSIKREARRLFAQHGIDGVSVRDIATAAGQRNSGSVQYYFGTKEALVVELVVDGARLIDVQRNRLLDQYSDVCRRGGMALSLRQVLQILVESSVPAGGDTGEERTYLRFIQKLQASHRPLFVSALANKWNRGYLRCLDEARRLLPRLPLPILNQRLVFMSLYLGAVLAAREAVRDETSRRDHRFWEAPHMLENLIDTLHAMLAVEPSAATGFAFAGGANERPGVSPAPAAGLE